MRNVRRPSCLCGFEGYRKQEKKFFLFFHLQQMIRTTAWVWFWKRKSSRDVTDYKCDVRI